MHNITSYRFGFIEIDGQPYSNDLIILPDKIISSWWRKDGHNVLPEDLDDVINAKPELLVMGQGAFGVMKISDEAKKLLKDTGIELVFSNTEPACRIFNEYQTVGKRVAGAFHLTC